MLKKVIYLVFFVVFLSTPFGSNISVSAEEKSSEKARVVSYLDKNLTWNPCPAFIPEGCEIAFLHGAPEDNNLDVFFKVPGNFKIPYHKHTSQERMILVSGELEVHYEGQETQVLKIGEYAYGPKELPHDAFCREGDPCILFIGFVAPLDAMPVEELPHY